MKVVAGTETGEILGALIMCERVADVIRKFALAVVNHLTA